MTDKPTTHTHFTFEPPPRSSVTINLVAIGQVAMALGVKPKEAAETAARINNSVNRRLELIGLVDKQSPDLLNTLGVEDKGFDEILAALQRELVPEAVREIGNSPRNLTDFTKPPIEYKDRTPGADHLKRDDKPLG